MSIYSIEKLHFCGEGIAFDANHRMIRIANALPGETVCAEEVSIRRRKQAYLLDVISESPDRCYAICGQWRHCPACQFQCLNKEAQQTIKKENWLRLIRKFISIPETCKVEFKPALETLEYRHRTDASIFKTADDQHCIGILPRLDAAVFDAVHPADASFVEIPDFSQAEAEEILSLDNIQPISMCRCALQAPELNELIRNVQNALAELPFSLHTRFGFEANGANARVTVYAIPKESDEMRRYAEKLSQLLGIPVIFQELPPKGSHVYPKPKAFGDPWYCYSNDIHGDTLYALKGAWTPVNPVNAQLIRDTLSEMISDRHFDNALELGCGCGTHTTLFNQAASHYVGIDASWPAIQSAQHNAEVHGWKNVSFYTDTAEHYLDKRYYKGCRADAILMHSNRMPYSAKTAELCKRFGAQTIYIVAPTAFAIAQECRHFSDLGYNLKRLVMCDTLPMTYHMMAAACLTFES